MQAPYIDCIFHSRIFVKYFFGIISNEPPIKHPLLTLEGENILPLFTYGKWDFQTQNFSNMVTVTDYAIRENRDGEPFVALILQGDLEMVRSQESGRFYATARTCSIPSTFTELVAQKMIGQQIPGRIVKQECEPYEYTIPESGEVVTLSHTWEYVPEEKKERAPRVQPQSLTQLGRDQLNDDGPRRSLKSVEAEAKQLQENDKHMEEAAF